MKEFAEKHIAVNTQSSVRITGEGGAVTYVDPLEIAGEPHDADLVLVTHRHGDHFSPSDIAKLTKPTTVIAAPEGMAKDAEKSLGKPVLSVRPGESYEAGGVRFETVAAYNKLKPFHPKSAGWVGYVVVMDGRRIYVAGDTDATKEAEETVCDVALLPVGGKYTMTAKEAAELVNRMKKKPAVAIPTHYGTIVGKSTDGADFASGVEDGVEVVLKLG